MAVSSPRGSQEWAPGSFTRPSSDTRAPPLLRAFRQPRPLQNASPVSRPLVPHRPSPRAQPPRPPPCPGAMAAARPCRASRRPGRGAPPGPAPRPLPPRPRARGWPRSSYLVRPFGRLWLPPARLALARSLALSLRRAAVRSRLHRVPARGDGSGRRLSSRRSPRGRARRSRAETRARAPPATPSAPRASARSFLVPPGARSRAPLSLAPPLQPPWRSLEPPPHTRGGCSLRRTARSPSLPRWGGSLTLLPSQVPRATSTCCLSWTGLTTT